MTLGVLIDKAEKLTIGTTNRHERIDPEYLERRGQELDEVARRLGFAKPS